MLPPNISRRRWDHSQNTDAVRALPIEATKDQSLHDFLGIYVNDFIPMAINCGNAWYYDVFQANVINEEDSISYKNTMKGEGVWALQKDILGFRFDGEVGAKTMQLEG